MWNKNLSQEIKKRIFHRDDENVKQGPRDGNAAMFPAVEVRSAEVWRRINVNEMLVSH